MTADAITRHGEPLIITRTASGKHHLFYRYNGEGRRIRPWVGLEIDVLGDNGFAVAAPSKLIKGAYEIVQGHLDDLDLPQANGGGEYRDPAPLPAKWCGMRQGDGRNRALWERCMRAGAGFPRTNDRVGKASKPVIQGAAYGCRSREDRNLCLAARRCRTNFFPPRGS